MFPKSELPREALKENLRIGEKSTHNLFYQDEIFFKNLIEFSKNMSIDFCCAKLPRF